MLDLTDVRSEEISSLVRHSFLSSSVSSLNAVLFVLGTIGWTDSWLIWVWLAAALSVFVWLGFRSHKARDVKVRGASRRAVRHAMIFSVVSALPWAVLPHLFYDTPNVKVMSLMVCVGIAAGGAFMLHRVPIAAISYFSTVLLSVVIALAIHDYGVTWKIALYAVPFWILLFSMTASTWRTSREREENLSQAENALKTLQGVNSKLNALKSAAEFEAHHDPLTGLANRRALESEMLRRTAALGEGQGGIAVLHVDLDRFKEINDTMGHAAGDHVLVHVARILRRATEPGDFVARVGGDEFVILRNVNIVRSALASLAERIIGRLSEPITYLGSPCSFGASIGIDISYGSDTVLGLEPDMMLANADMALYLAKETGRGRYEFYSHSLREEAERNRVLSDELILAIRRDEFVPVFQPQFDATTGKICGVEALARWCHPQRGMLLPGVFMPIADRLGLSQEIDRKIFHESVKAITSWDASGVQVPQLSVNVSVKRLRDPVFISELLASEISPSRLSVEVLESVFIDKVDDEMRHTLDQFEELGIDIEIDDFGTGHASLLSLMILRPRRLKIARELVGPAATSSSYRDLLQAVIDISESLQVEITAEGVETKEQAELLTALGCHRLQGFYFAKPMFFGEFQHFMQQNDVGRLPLSA